LTGKAYSDSNSANPTPWASYTYKQGLAHLGVCGRHYLCVHHVRNAITFGYNYNLIDEITSMTTPSRTVVTTVVTTGYDNLGRSNTLSGKVGSNTTSYVTSVSYVPQWHKL
jgi:hypothetical protein